MVLGVDLPFYEGWCRYGSDNRGWMEGHATNNDVKCYEICQNTNGCSAFSFEYSTVDEPCNTYTDGPYTYGNDRVNTKCYILPNGKRLDNYGSNYFHASGIKFESFHILS